MLLLHMQAKKPPLIQLVAGFKRCLVTTDHTAEMQPFCGVKAQIYNTRAHSIESLFYLQSKTIPSFLPCYLFLSISSWCNPTGTKKKKGKQNQAKGSCSSHYEGCSSHPFSSKYHLNLVQLNKLRSHR